MGAEVPVPRPHHANPPPSLRRPESTVLPRRLARALRPSASTTPNATTITPMPERRTSPLGAECYGGNWPDTTKPATTSAALTQSSQARTPPGIRHHGKADSAPEYRRSTRAGKAESTEEQLVHDQETCDGFGNGELTSSSSCRYKRTCSGSYPVRPPGTVLQLISSSDFQNTENQNIPIPGIPPKQPENSAE
jgi:hypothetical protein